MTSARRLKIVHVAATPTGAPWMVALMREQQRLGHDVAAIVPARDGGIGAQLDALGIPCHAAGVDALYASGGLASRAATLVRLARLLRRLRPDVVHSHIVNSVVTARLASWIADVPMHIGANAHPLSLESALIRPIEIGTAFCDTVTIASCMYTRDLMLASGLPASQVELVYYAVDQSRHYPAVVDGRPVRDALGLAPGTPVIGKIAYFYPPARSAGLVPARLMGRGIKGHDVLIRAMPLVRRSVPDATCVLVGRGWGPGGAAYEAELKTLASQLGVADATRFVGERPDVPELLAAFDVSAHCSLSDNLAGTVETLLMARPLVVSDIPGFRDVVLHEQTGLVVPADDPAALADALVRLLRDRPLAQRLGEDGRRHVLARFTLARNVEALEQILAARSATLRRGYRLRVSAARVCALPVRLAPVAIAVHGAAKRHGFRIGRYLGRRMLHAAYRVLAAIRRRLVTSADSA